MIRATQSVVPSQLAIPSKWCRVTAAHRSCHYSDWICALENQCGAGYVGGTRGRCARVARDKISGLVHAPGPRTLFPVDPTFSY
jgi:hypothetical protein